jgi:DNA-binding NarL/FixJ family response regulator
VSHLVLLGTAAKGSRRVPRTAEQLAELETLDNLVRIGWARENPVFRRVFTNIFIPGASEKQVRWFDDLQRMSTSTENAVRTRHERSEVDVRDVLARIRVPTLVLHARDDAAIPFEWGRELASGIRGARFVPLDSANHILLADEPAWREVVLEIREFLATDTGAAEPPSPEPRDVLSRRELDVLRLAAEGRTNAEIGDALTLSIRTIERHLSNAYDKLGVSGRAARAAAVARVVGGRSAQGRSTRRSS